MAVGLSFGVEGQPVGGNAGYEIGRGPRTGRHGKLRLGDDGSRIERRTIIKTAEAKVYTELVAIRAREAMPSGWAPEELIVVELYFFLGREIDCDNRMKFIDDGIQLGTGVNDKWFLPRAMTKVAGLRPPSRRVVVSIVDLASVASAPAS